MLSIIPIFVVDIIAYWFRM